MCKCSLARMTVVCLQLHTQQHLHWESSQEIICTISLRWENISTNHFRWRQWHSFPWRKKDGTKRWRWRQRKKFLSVAIVVCQSFQIHGGSNAATARIGFISIHASVFPLRHYSQRTTGFVIAVRELTVFLYAIFLGLYNIKWLSLANNWLGTRDWERADRPLPDFTIYGFSNARFLWTFTWSRSDYATKNNFDSPTVYCQYCRGVRKYYRPLQCCLEPHSLFAFVETTVPLEYSRIKSVRLGQDCCWTPANWSGDLSR